MKKPALSSLSPEQYQARLRKILLAGLGKSWMHWPPRAEVKKRCAIKEKPGWFRCEICQQEREKIEIDHIIPCIKPSEGFTTWDAYINARFVGDAKKLQGLCRECHKEKSKKENALRKNRRKSSEHNG